MTGKPDGFFESPQEILFRLSAVSRLSQVCQDRVALPVSCQCDDATVSTPLTFESLLGCRLGTVAYCRCSDGFPAGPGFGLDDFLLENEWIPVAEYFHRNVVGVEVINQVGVIILSSSNLANRYLSSSQIILFN